MGSELAKIIRECLVDNDLTLYIALAPYFGLFSVIVPGIEVTPYFPLEILALTLYALLLAFCMIFHAISAP